MVEFKDYWKPIRKDLVSESFKTNNETTYYMSLKKISDTIINKNESLKKKKELRLAFTGNSISP